MSADPSVRRLLVLSHSCVTPINQQFYADVESLTGWSMTIVSPAGWKDDYGARRTLERWPAYRGALHALPVWKSGSIPLHAYRSLFAGLLRTYMPDVIYVHHEPYAVATFQIYAANRLSVRRPIGFFTWQNIHKRYPVPFRQLEHIVLRQSAFAFPGSQSAEAVLRRKGYSGPSTLLPASIDPELYTVDADANGLKNRLRSTREEVLIGYVGRIAEEKGLKTLLYALEQIRHLPWRLIVVGTGKYETDFDALAHDLNLATRIQRVGYVSHEQTPRYLAAFDVLVLPSETQSNWKEQFGRVLIEALASQTPLVGSDSGEIPFIIRQTRGGLVFQERNQEDLARQLQRMITDPSLRARLAREGHRFVLRHYSGQSLARRFCETIEEASRIGRENGRITPST